MAKTRLNGSLKYVVAVITLLITAATLLWAGGRRASTLEAHIETNATEITRVDNEGCNPSEDVRRDIVEIKTNYSHIQTQMDKMDAKLDKLLAK